MPSQDSLWYSHIHPTPSLAWQPIAIPISINMLFNICLVNEIMQYVFFCDWLFFMQLNFLEGHPYCCIYQKFDFFCISKDFSMIWNFHSLLNHLPIKNTLKKFPGASNCKSNCYKRSCTSFYK